MVDILTVNAETGEASVIQGSIPETSLALLKAEKIAWLKESFRTTCCAGHESSALGTAHIYDTEQGDGKQDQFNLLVSFSIATANVDTPAWVRKITCTEVATGIKSRKEHTATQIITATSEVNAMIDTHLDTLWSKIDQVNAATTAAEVAAVV